MRAVHQRRFVLGCELGSQFQGGEVVRVDHVEYALGCVEASGLRPGAERGVAVLREQCPPQGAQMGGQHPATGRAQDRR
jgi:hypothetical protein